MIHYSIIDMGMIKEKFELIAKENNVLIINGTAEINGKHQIHSYIQVDVDDDFEWNELLKRIGQSLNPVIILEINYFDTEDFNCLPDNEEVTKELLGQNYSEIKKKINEYRAILEKTKINDIVSMTVYCIYGNYLIEQTYYSILSEVKYFDIEEFYAQEEEEVEEEFIAPSKAQIKRFQDDLKQRLIADPNFILCSNKNLRQSFMREIIDEMADEMKMDDKTAYYYSRDCLHIVEMAYMQVKNK